MEGRVEILHNGQWGTVCDDYWDELDATVVCGQLGFFGDSFAVSGAQFGAGDSSLRIWLDNVHCTGTESYLSNCLSNGWGVHNCGHYEDAGVICQGSEYDIPVRLANGSTSSEGRVEIYWNGGWGTICDIYWGLSDATVICRQLGYSGASDAVYGSFFGAGDLPIILAYPFCVGYEPQLANCSGIYFGSSVPSYCNQDNVAGVRCIGEYACSITT